MKIIPVIHMTSPNQVLLNVETIIQCGLNSAFLINHEVTAGKLISEAHYIKYLLPDFEIGLNILGASTKYALQERFPVWCDETPTHEDYLGRKSPLVFGGLAFKYQPQPTDIKAACQEIKECVDVATTSGDGTGIPAHLSKIRTIREYLGDFPLAIASGLSPKNIRDYVGLADYGLVATSITDHNEMIIKDKLLELLERSC